MKSRGLDDGWFIICPPELTVKQSTKRGVAGDISTSASRQPSSLCGTNQRKARAKEAETKNLDVDLHAKQQSIVMCQ